MNPLIIEHLGRDIRHGFLGRRLTLLDDISFEVAPGQTVGFVGRNGAGKTTTIRCIVGLSRPSRGSISVFGGPPRDPAVRRQLGYLPESVILPGSLTVQETLRLHAALAGVVVDEGACLREVDLIDVRRRLVRDLSKGLQTRLGLALVFLSKPKLLILDEPMSGLDPVGRQLVRDLIRQNAVDGASVLFSSHVLSDVEALSDRVVVIEKGRIVHQGPVATSGRGWEILTVPPAGLAIEGQRKEAGLVVFERDDDGLAAAQELRSQGHEVRIVRPARSSLESQINSILSA